MFWLECISPIAKGDLKWRDALLVAHRVNSNKSLLLSLCMANGCLKYSSTDILITYLTSGI